MTPVTKSHRFYAPDPSRDTHECASCGMGNFTDQQIAAGKLFPCSHHLDKEWLAGITQRERMARRGT